MHALCTKHFLALKRILHYVRGTIQFGLNLSLSLITQLMSYSDADWVDVQTPNAFTFGYYVFIGDNLISWSFKRQPLSLSLSLSL